MSKGSLYLYAVVPSDTGAPAGPGLGDRPVSVVTSGRLGVLVSEVGDGPLQVSGANLRRHQQVVEEAHRATTTLPFRYGVVADSERALVESFLEDHAELLASKLGDFEGTTELRVTARYQGDAALRELLETSPRLRRLRRSIAGRPEAATYHARIELGEEVAAGLAGLRERDSAACSRLLSRRARLERPLEPVSQEQAFRAAYLVARGELAHFEAALEEYSREQQGRLDIELTGPMAPWDFVEMDRSDLEASRRLTTSGHKGRWAS